MKYPRTDYVNPDPPLMIDYPSLRVDSAHEETPRRAGTWCEVCGWVDELTLGDPNITLWHGDSFGLETTYEEWECVREWIRRRAMVAAKHERTGGPDEQELADMGRSS